MSEKVKCRPLIECFPSHAGERVVLKCREHGDVAQRTGPRAFESRAEIRSWAHEEFQRHVERVEKPAVNFEI